MFIEKLIIFIRCQIILVNLLFFHFERIKKQPLAGKSYLNFVCAEIVAFSLVFFSKRGSQRVGNSYLLKRLTLSPEKRISPSPGRIRPFLHAVQQAYCTIFLSLFQVKI